MTQAQLEALQLEISTKIMDVVKDPCMDKFHKAKVLEALNKDLDSLNRAAYYIMKLTK